MKKAFFFIFLSVLLSGCATILDQKVYIQDMTIKAPIHLPPMNIVDSTSKNRFVVTPKLQVNPKQTIKGNVFHSRVNSKGVFQVDTVNGRLKESQENKFEFKGENIMWDMPEFTAGIDLQLPIMTNMNFDAGIAYSENLYSDLIGANLGFTFFNVREGGSTSFSLGVHAQETYYTAKTAVITTYEEAWGNDIYTDVSFYNDRNKDFSYNIYATLMFNIFSKFLNFSIAGSFFSQSVVKYYSREFDAAYAPFNYFNSTGEGAKLSEYGAFVSLTPGVYTYIAEHMRLSGNLNLIYELGNLNPGAKRPLLIVPVVKADFVF